MRHTTPDVTNPDPARGDEPVGMGDPDARASRVPTRRSRLYGSRAAAMRLPWAKTRAPTPLPRRLPLEEPASAARAAAPQIPEHAPIAPSEPEPAEAPWRLAIGVFDQEPSQRAAPPPLAEPWSLDAVPIGHLEIEPLADDAPVSRIAPHLPSRDSSPPLDSLRAITSSAPRNAELASLWKELVAPPPALGIPPTPPAAVAPAPARPALERASGAPRAAAVQRGHRALWTLGGLALGAVLATAASAAVLRGAEQPVYLLSFGPPQPSPSDLAAPHAPHGPARSPAGERAIAPAAVAEASFVTRAALGPPPSDPRTPEVPRAAAAPSVPAEPLPLGSRESPRLPVDAPTTQEASTEASAGVMVFTAEEAGTALNAAPPAARQRRHAASSAESAAPTARGGGERFPPSASDPAPSPPASERNEGAASTASTAPPQRTEATAPAQSAERAEPAAPAPPAERAEPAESTPPAHPAETAQPAASTAPASPRPETPSRDDVRAALDAVTPAVRACAPDASTTVARVTVTFSSSGRATTANVDLPFAGTPEGSCIARALRRASVPSFQRPTFQVSAPIGLR